MYDECVFDFAVLLRALRFSFWLGFGLVSVLTY
jgi:hypothetical protein